jgi:hypothetical protein
MFTTFSDFHGAKAAGFEARLLRRPGADGEQEHKEPGEDLTSVDVIHSLDDILDIVASK